MEDKAIISTIPLGQYGYKSFHEKEVRTCPQCGQTFTRYKDEVEYIFAGLKFCHFPCKNQYRKAHPELDLTFAEKCEIEASWKNINQRPSVKKKNELIKKIMHIDLTQNAEDLKFYTKPQLEKLLKELTK